MGTSKPRRHLKLVADHTELIGDADLGDHSDRAAKMIVDLLNLWKRTVTHEISVDSASRIGLVIATEHLRAVETITLARAQPATVP